MDQAERDRDQGAAALGLAELVGLGAVASVALVTVTSLVTGLLGVHAPVPILAGAAAMGLAATALAVRQPVTVHRDPTGTALALLVSGLAAALFIPGSPYASGDRDPGVYTSHAFVISRTGSVWIDDPVAARSDDVPVITTDQPPVRGPHGRFPGLWPTEDDATRVKPQFYDAWATLLALGAELAGPSGVFGLTPFLGILSVAVLSLAVRRAFDTTTGAFAAVLLSVGQLQVWQARYPTSEVLTQLLGVGALAGLVITLSLRWRPAAALAGLCTGTIFVVRPDGILGIVMAAAAGGLLIATDRFDRRTWWFTAGMLAVLPLGLYDGYGLNGFYTTANTAPSLAVLAAVCAGLLALGLGGRVLLTRFGPRLGDPLGRLEPVRAQRLAGSALTVALAAFVAFATVRPFVMADHTAVTSRGFVVRTYNEETLHRLAWFLSWPGIIAVVVGFGVVAVRPWRAERWALILPGTLLLPLYVWSPRISSRLLWWGRRFVPLVLVTAVVLISVSVGRGITWRGRGRGRVPVRATAWGLGAFLVCFALSTSLPMLDHREFDGSYDTVTRLAALPEAEGSEQAVFLWTRPTGGVYEPARVFGGPLWLIGDQISAVLPDDPSAADVEAFADAFPGLPIFLVTPGGPPPSTLEDLVAPAPVLDEAITLPFWVESDTFRPDRAEVLTIPLAVWQVP